MTYPFEGSSDEPTYADGIEAETETETEAEADEHEIVAEKKTSRRKSTRSAPRLNAGQVRRVLAQADVIEQLATAERDLLAATVGTASSTEDLVVATLAHTKAGEVIGELLTVAAEDEGFKPVVLAHALISERDNARRTWAILTALGKVTGTIPAKDIQAAEVVAVAAKALSLDDLAALEVVTDLLG